jgi:ABC-2 type transport system ATP-binding protein
MLEAIALTKTFGTRTALESLHLRVLPGEIHCLLGANGAGKTTTLNLFLDFIRPTSGEARVAGIRVDRRPEETKRHLAYIPENVTLYPTLTGLENLDFFCGLAGIRPGRQRLGEILARAGLNPDHHRRRLSAYSKGMRQKVGIAIALAKEAGALLLDEPTSGLDPQAADEFSRLLAELSRAGVAVLMATHDLFRAKEIGTHIGIMKDGRLVESLAAADIGVTDLERIYLRHMKGRAAREDARVF